MKIIEKVQSAIAAGRSFYSFEYFPPKTEPGLNNLYARIERMGQWHPLFVTITWGAGGSSTDLSFDIAKNIQNLTGMETMMHLTCSRLSRREIGDVLQATRQRGIQNIMALRGDAAGGGAWQPHPEGFRFATDLVRFIRESHGDYFGIAVAAYPERHCKEATYAQELGFLKEKIDAGADLVITQLVYDIDIFLRFVDECRQIGITCPIIPGLLPIHNYRSFTKIARFAASIPAKIVERVEANKDDDEAIKAYGVSLLIEQIACLQAAKVPGVHLYTLNLEAVVTQALEQLRLPVQSDEKPLPWERPASVRRSHEDVRPIFWANRPKSYLARTMGWDEFPNGRWGDSRSPAFGDQDAFALEQALPSHFDPRRAWGEAPTTFQDIMDVFVSFCAGETPAIPWYDSPLARESGPLREPLMLLNSRGFLTINSQPRVNGAPSGDPAVGWGGPHGRVYQKAYLEFFLPAPVLPALLAALEAQPSFSYHAVNTHGDSISNCPHVNAVTWGVFPGREIIQPTVVDPVSFMVWKDEAFALWKRLWGAIYDEDSPSRALIQRIYDTFYLVNVVDNDYVDGDLWATFTALSASLGAHRCEP